MTFSMEQNKDTRNMPKLPKVDKSVKNWFQKWRMYIFIVVGIGSVFAISLLLTLLGLMGVIIPFPMLWVIATFILGMVMLTFVIIIIGYILLMIKKQK